MTWTDSNQNLRFKRNTQAFPRRLIPVGLTLLVFTLMWKLFPHSTLFWLLLPMQLGLVWMASYGWRQAVTILINLLYRLQQL